MPASLCGMRSRENSFPISFHTKDLLTKKTDDYDYQSPSLVQPSTSTTSSLLAVLAAVRNQRNKMKGRKGKLSCARLRLLPAR